MRARWSTGLVVIAVALVTACGDAVGPGQNMLSVEFSDGGLIATNRTLTPLYFVAVNPRAAIQWTPCVDPVACPDIPPRATVVIPFADVLGWEGDPEAADVSLHFYRLIPAAGGGFRPDEMREIVVRR